MTGLSTLDSQPLRHTPEARWRRFRKASPALALGAAVFLGLAVLVLLPLALDARQWQGTSTWLKPWKFFVSIALQLLTMALLAGAISPAGLARRSTRVWTVVALASAAFEAAYITLMAALNQGSHYNVASPLLATMYSLMGVGAVSLSASAAAFGVQVMRLPRAGLAPALRWGFGIALVVGALLGTLTGAYMGSQPSHWVGGVHSDAGGLPLLGWSRSGGDLRIAHFVGLHAMQGLALVAWCLHRQAPTVALQRRAVLGTVVAALLWAALTALLLRHAVAGSPLIAA